MTSALTRELKRCSDEIWESLPDGLSGIGEITVRVAKLSAYMDAIIDAEEALRAHQRELLEFMKDAERYRFIMSGKRFGVIDREGSTQLVLQGTAWDATIDSAMSAAPRDEKEGK